METLKLRLPLLSSQGLWLLVWPPKSFILSSLLPPCFPRLFTATGFLTHNLNTSHPYILFIFLVKLSELTFDLSTVDLDFAIVCVSVHFWKENLKTCRKWTLLYDHRHTTLVFIMIKIIVTWYRELNIHQISRWALCIYNTILDQYYFILWIRKTKVQRGHVILPVCI